MRIGITFRTSVFALAVLAGVSSAAATPTAEALPATAAPLSCGDELSVQAPLVVAHARASGLVPTETVIVSARWASADSPPIVDLLLAIPAPGLASLDESSIARLNAVALDLWGPCGVRGVILRAVDPETGLARLLVDFLPPIEPPPTKEGETHDLPSLSPGIPPGFAPFAVIGDTLQPPGGPAGALSGKVVYVSQGHGFTWNDVLDRWATQRGNTHNIVEDLVNAEGINHYLVHYLRNMGATVFTTREHDLQREMAIVDDAGGDGQFLGGDGWSESSGGFEWGLAPYVGQINPFDEGSHLAKPAVTGAPSSTVSWVPDLPAAGFYNVYASWTQGADRTADAHYVIQHPGGETHVRVDQRRHGKTWVFLGRFWFGSGYDPGTGAVLLYDDSQVSPGALVVADAVRFGGGTGDIVRGTGSGTADGPTSGRPRWEECARYNTQFQGAPPSVYDYSSTDPKDDVSSRSRYAAWQNESGEDSVYLSWHTNAPSPGVGTSTFVYGPNPPNGTFQYAATEGSDLLQDAVHGELINDFQAAFDPDWKDRGQYTAYFGEVNPGHNPEMPAVLIELAFHDTASDAAYLKQPRFRQTASRAMAQGIAKYFGLRDGYTPTLPPEPPRSLVVRNSGDGGLEISWQPASADTDDLGGDPAAGYRVYASADGRSWMMTAETSQTTVAIDDLEPGVPVYIRVTATNAGGESFPTGVLGAVPFCGPSAALVVDGFVRLDAFSLIDEDLSPWSLATIERLDQLRMNSFDYVRQHGGALGAIQMGFDSAQASAVEEEAVELADYAFVDWILGEESTADATFNASEQLLITDYLAGDGALFASGAEIAWDLDLQGSDSDIAFLAETFGVLYDADDAGTYTIGAGYGDFESIGPFTFDDGTGDTFDVGYPDVFAPVGDSAVVLDYGSGGGLGPAGVWHVPEGGGQTMLWGFPFETVDESAQREALMDSVLTTMDIGGAPFDSWTCADEEPPPADTGGGRGDAGGSEEGGGESDAGIAEDVGVGEDAGEEPPADADSSEEGSENPGEDAEGGADAPDADAVPDPEGLDTPSTEEGGGGIPVTVLPPSGDSSGQPSSLRSDSGGCSARGPGATSSWPRGAFATWWLLFLALCARRATGGGRRG